MNTVTLSLEDYNELKQRADAFNQIQKDSYAIRVNWYSYSPTTYLILNRSQAEIEAKKEIDLMNELINKLKKDLQTEKDKSLWQRLFK